MEQQATTIDMVNGLVEIADYMEDEEAIHANKWNVFQEIPL